MGTRARLTRRRLLQLTALLPLGALIDACGGSSSAKEQRALSTPVPPTNVPEPTATPTPEPPFIVPSGEQQRALMQGTPHETVMHVFGTGKEGPVLAVLGGVHGNEPGGWLAAERVRDEVRPSAGALIVVPRANVVATQQFVRTTDEMGDLNRLYPGDPDGLPMAQMAYEITETLREFHTTHVLDLHESWGFFRDRTEQQRGTAFLGQTVSSSTARGLALGRNIVAAVNERVQAAHEEMIVREWPPRGFTFPTPTPGASEDGDRDPSNDGFSFRRRSRSSLGLSRHIPGTIALLVEMGQQQPLERRVALHLEVVQETMKQVGI